MRQGGGRYDGMSAWGSSLQFLMPFFNSKTSSLKKMDHSKLALELLTDLAALTFMMGVLKALLLADFRLELFDSLVSRSC